MRVFIGLDIPEDIRQRIAAYMRKAQALAPDAKWVRPESFHVTLKFVGEQSQEMVEKIKEALAEVKSNRPELFFREYGFFPTPTSPRVLWVGIDAGIELAHLATSVDIAVASLGLPREEHSYRPHLTLARSGSGAPRGLASDKPSGTLRSLSEKLKSLGPADFGGMQPRSFFLYQSQLSPQGAKYTKIAEFPLR